MSDTVEVVGRFKMYPEPGLRVMVAVLVFLAAANSVNVTVAEFEPAGIVT
jgi:hypothetical protein